MFAGASVVVHAGHGETFERANAVCRLANRLHAPASVRTELCSPAHVAQAANVSANNKAA